ncbi:MAG: hypothetical protein Q8J88_12295 [Bacteroidales bacterium]|nr:hypothetical protein [Bacteroidales bacterium]
MKKVIKIINKHQNINKIESFIDEISQRFELYSTYYSNIMTVTDRLFGYLCDLKSETEIVISFDHDKDSLHFVWSFEKEFFEDSDFNMTNVSSDLFQMTERLTDGLFIDHNSSELHLYFASGSFNQHLARERRMQLQTYFGKKVFKNRFNDSLSDN